MPEITPSRPPTIFVSRFVQLLVAIFLLVALIRQQRDFILFAVILLGIVNGADVWSRFGRSRLLISSAIDKKRAFPGESIQLDLRMANRKWLPVWLKVILPVSDDLSAPPGETERPRQGGLLWYQKVRFSWKLTAPKRGIYPVGPPRIAVGDLMGFFPRRIAEGQDLEIVVYPRRVPLRPVSLPKRDFFGVPGAISPVKDPVYIMGTRDYQHGRPARDIHWKASARRNELQEKIFEPSRQARILMLFDVDGYGTHSAAEAFEQAVEAAASLAVEFHRRNFALGFATNGRVQGGRPSIIPLARGPRQPARILETMAGLTMDSCGDIHACIRNTGLLAGGISCVGFAFEESPAAVKNMAYLNRRHIPTVTVFNRCSDTAATNRFSKIHTACCLDDILVKGTGRI